MLGAMLGRKARLTPVLVALFATGLSAQSWKIQDEIEFAKSMARYRLFDLSNEYLEELGRQNLDKDDAASLSYMRAFLYKVAGDYADGLEARMGYLREAVTAYDKFLEEAPKDHTAYDTANTEAAEVQRKIGALLFEQIRRGEASETAREEAEKAFRGAIKKLNDELSRKRAMFHDWADTREIGETEEEIADADIEFQNRNIEANQPLLELVATYVDFSQLYGPTEFNHKDYLQNAVDKVEEYLWEVSVAAIPHYQAYQYYGMALLGLEREDDGKACLDTVLDMENGVASIISNNRDSLPAAAVVLVSDLYEKTVLGAMRHYNGSGKYDVSLTFKTRLDEFYKAFRDLVPKPGDNGVLCQLEEGRAKHLQGTSEGMQILQKVASEHAGDFLGSEAAQVITELARGSGESVASVIPASVWITAAERASQEHEDFAAIENYHKALAAVGTITDPAEAKTTSIQCWSAIGRTYRGQGRLVEAIVALQQAFQLCSAQEDIEGVGGTLFNTYQRRVKETKDKQDDKRKNDFMQELSRKGVPDMAFLTARDDFEAARALANEGEVAKDRKKGLEDALDQFKGIDKDNKNYERAQVYLARSEAELGNFKNAVKAIDQYLAFAADEKNAIPSHKREERQNRDIAMTEATYYKSLFQAELGLHKDVQVTLADFEKRFPEQDKFFSQVNYQRLRSFLALDPPDIANAEKLFTEKYAEGQLPLEARYFLARALLDKAKALEDAGKTEEAKPLRAKGAEHMYAYCEASGFNSYSNLKVSGDSYGAIQDWPNAARVYAKIVAQFGNDQKLADSIQKVVKRQLVEALLAQDKFQEAAPYVTDMLSKEKRPDIGLMRLAAMVYGGRVDVVNNRPIEVPGGGNYPEAVKWWDEIAKYLRQDGKYTQAWWEAKFYSIYCRYRARDVAAEWENQAKEVARNLKTTELLLIDRNDWALTFEGEDGNKTGPRYPFGDPMKRRFEYILQQLGLND